MTELEVIQNTHRQVETEDTIERFDRIVGPLGSQALRRSQMVLEDPESDDGDTIKRALE